MAKGISIHVGVNRTIAPEINVPDLLGAVNDAQAMHDLAAAAGFSADPPITDGNATYEHVFDAIVKASSRVVDGDVFLFTFSGHGTRQAAIDITGDPDGKDETIVLHDRVMIDNVFRRVLWPKFPKNVRILAISDSCHSGSVFEAKLVGTPAQPIAVFPEPAGVHAIADISLADLSGSSRVKDSVPLYFAIPVELAELIGNRRFRTIPDDQITRHFEVLVDFYSKVLESIPSGPLPPLAASLLTLAACKDNQLTADGVLNGAFTSALLAVWDHSSFQGNYDQFINAIGQKLPGQTPVRMPKDPKADPNFVSQRPFTI
jgi:hypothetical protein